MPPPALPPLCIEQCNHTSCPPPSPRSVKVDVYALGVILNECYTRRQPWRDSAHFFQIILKVSVRMRCVAVYSWVGMWVGASGWCQP